MDRGLFYHFCPGKDAGHGVHLYRLAEALRRGSRGRLSLTLLRDADASFPPRKEWKYGAFIPLPPDFRKNGPARRKIISAALSARPLPRFLLTAFFPFGRTACAPEILPALRSARKAGVLAYASVPMPYFSHGESRLDELYRAAELYDRIFVHCPPGRDLKYMAAAAPFEKRITAARFLRVFRDLAPRMIFTGYVLPPGVRDRKPGISSEVIVVHRGGGSTSPEIITAAILAKPQLKSRLPMTVVAGPASTAAELRRWRDLIRREGVKGITLLKTSDRMIGLLARAAVVAGTAGGTVYETLFLRKKTLLLPFTGSAGAEHSDQLARAAMMKELAGAAVLDGRTTDPAEFARTLDALLSGPAPEFRPAAGEFGGAEAAASRILSDMRFS